MHGGQLRSVATGLYLTPELRMAAEPSGRFYPTQAGALRTSSGLALTAQATLGDRGVPLSYQDARLTPTSSYPGPQVLARYVPESFDGAVWHDVTGNGHDARRVVATPEGAVRSAQFPPSVARQAALWVAWARGGPVLQGTAWPDDDAWHIVAHGVVHDGRETVRVAVTDGEVRVVSRDAWCPEDCNPAWTYVAPKELGAVWAVAAGLGDLPFPVPQK